MNGHTSCGLMLRTCALRVFGKQICVVFCALSLTMGTQGNRIFAGEDARGADRPASDRQHTLTDPFAYDSETDFGVVVGYPHMIWLQDHGDLINTNEPLGLSKTHTLAAKPRLDRAVADWDFALLFVSGLDDLITPGQDGDKKWFDCMPLHIPDSTGRTVPAETGEKADARQGIIAAGPPPAWGTEAGEMPTREALLRAIGMCWKPVVQTSIAGIDLGEGLWNDQRGDDGCFDVDSLLGGCVGSDMHFSFLDLYLMGLAGAHEVPTYEFVDKRGRRTPVPIETIIEATQLSDAQTAEPFDQLNVVFVVVTPEACMPTLSDMQTLDQWRRKLPDWWAFATDYRSTLDTNLPSCGDGNVGLGEECDDGNTYDGDGCSAACLTEPPPSGMNPWALGALLATMTAIGAILRTGPKEDTARLRHKPFDNQQHRAAACR